jgi:hypothetical protein
MQISRETKYQCKFCRKEYKEKFNLDRHVVCCEYFHKTIRQQDNEAEVSAEYIPPPNKMYLLIQDLMLRVDKLEKENAKLKSVQKRKMNIIEWLNQSSRPPPIISFDQFMSILLESVPQHLEDVFSDNLLSGLQKLFTNCITKLGTGMLELPLCAFANRPNTFYVYQPIENNSTLYHWKMFSAEEFDTCIERIANRFIYAFKHNWYLVYKDRILTDEKYKDMYVEYYQKVLGCQHMTSSTRCNKVRQFVYQLIKQQIKSIVEYDI